jgi:hypothetical protein
MARALIAIIIVTGAAALALNVGAAEAAPVKHCGSFTLPGGLRVANISTRFPGPSRGACMTARIQVGHQVTGGAPNVPIGPRFRVRWLGFYTRDGRNVSFTCRIRGGFRRPAHWRCGHGQWFIRWTMPRTGTGD